LFVKGELRSEERLRRCTRAQFATSCEKVTGGWKKLCVGGRSRLAGRRWSFSTGACCRGCAGQGGDHRALNGDGNFPRGYVVVAVGIRKTMSGLPEAAVIFGGTCWRGTGGSVARQRLPSGDGHFSRGYVVVVVVVPEPTGVAQRRWSFSAGYVAVVVVVREAASGFPAAKVIFHGDMLSSQWGPEDNERPPRGGGHFRWGVLPGWA
jgi:hypothetical protein